MGEEVSAGTSQAPNYDTEARAFLALLGERDRAKVDRGEHLEKVPTGYRIKGASTLYNGKGEVAAQWLKTREDDVDPAALLDIFAAMVKAKNIAAASPVLAPLPFVPQDSANDLSVWIPLGDPHVGLHSWGKETGEDWDLKIAERVFGNAIDGLVEQAPDACEAVVASVGDAVHIDTLSGRTTKGTQLDSDSRLGKIMRVSMFIWTHAIDRCLQKYPVVHGKFVVGNHDETMSMLLPLMLDAHYRNEPRVVIDTTPSAFMWHRFGKCLFGVNHGDKVKLADMAEIMACDRPKDWGETLYRHVYSGHLHHTQVKMLRGCTVETLPTLAATDSYHAAHGYRSARSVFLDVWHREYGFRCRHQRGIAELTA